MKIHEYHDELSDYDRRSLAKRATDPKRYNGSVKPLAEVTCAACHMPTPKWRVKCIHCSGRLKG